MMRSKHQEDAVRTLDDAVEAVAVVAHEAQLRESDEARLAIQDAHHDGFAARGRNERDAQVDRAPHQVDVDAAILGLAVLGDVHVGHHLEARDDRPGQLPVQGVRLEADTVHAIAHADAVGHRLDVDVGRPLGEGLFEDFLDEADDGRVFRLVLLVLDAAPFLLDLDLLAQAVCLGADVVQRRGRREGEGELAIEDEAQVVGGEGDHRVVCREDQLAVVQLDRNDAEVLHHVAGHEVRDALGDRGPAQVHEGQLELPAEGLRELDLVDEVELEQGLAQLDPRHPLEVLDALLELALVDMPHVEEDLTELLVGG